MKLSSWYMMKFDLNASHCVAKYIMDNMIGSDSQFWLVVFNVVCPK